MRPWVSFTVVAFVLGFSLHSAAGAEEQAAQPSAPPTAEEVQALRREIEELKTQIRTLRDQVGALIPAGQGTASGAAPSPPPTSGAPPVPSAAPSQTSNYFNPSISVIGNYLGVGGSNGTEDLPSSSLRESEVSLQAIVDPYARADFFLSFGEEGVDVEEGFATFT